MPVCLMFVIHRHYFRHVVLLWMMPGQNLQLRYRTLACPASQRTGVKVFCDGKLLTQGMVEPLKPYEQVVLTLKIENKVVSGQPSYEVVFLNYK